MNNRKEVQAQYVVRVIQDMTEKDRMAFAYNVLMDSFSTYSDEDMEAEIKEWFPEVLESN